MPKWAVTLLRFVESPGWDVLLGGKKTPRLTQFTPRQSRQSLSVLRRSHLFAVLPPFSKQHTAKTQSDPVLNWISGSEKWHQISNKSKFESENMRGEATRGHFHMTGLREVFLYPPLQLWESVSMTMRHFWGINEYELSDIAPPPISRQ